jgi:hypothetical protein
MHKNDRPIGATLLFGAISIALYAALLIKSDFLVELAQRTPKGETWLFLIPIVIAFLFSYVHGAFTGLFWESLGLKAAQNNNNNNKSK